MIEVLIPVRNPTGVFAATIDSLLAQTTRDFTVLLSDNFSTSGQEFIASTAERLQEGGIPIRLLRPPWELGRVQHWNWLHHQSEAAWLKPLFVGDWLEPDCLQACTETIAADPALRFLFFNFQHHHGDNVQTCDAQGLTGRVDPLVARDLAILSSNFVGGPINVLYHRAAFQAMGGHNTSLPYVADFDLYARLAMQVPTFSLARMLAHFHLHDTRFAKAGSGRARESMVGELFLLTAQLAYTAHVSGHPVAFWPLARRLGGLLFAWLGERLKQAVRPSR